jgi:hypothetical protein
VQGVDACNYRKRVLLSLSSNACVYIMPILFVTCTCIFPRRTPAALEKIESGVSRSASSGEVGDGDPVVDFEGRKTGGGLSARKEDVERELKVLDETVDNLESSRRVGATNRLMAHA